MSKPKKNFSGPTSAPKVARQGLKSLKMTPKEQKIKKVRKQKKRPKKYFDRAPKGSNDLKQQKMKKVREQTILTK